MTDVRIHPDARAELLAAATYYEEQSGGLGGQFIDEVQRVFDLVAESPSLGSPVPKHKPYRRWPLRRFPYRVIYRGTEGALFVLAVAHNRRRPGYWSRRS